MFLSMNESYDDPDMSVTKISPIKNPGNVMDETMIELEKSDICLPF